MSSPVNAFFKILVNGQQTGRTPELLVSGTLHCVELSTIQSTYLPIAYYTDGATANENSLTNIRVSTDQFGYANGSLQSKPAGASQKFKIVTYGFTLTAYDASGVVFALPYPAVTPTYTYDWSITRLDVMESLTVPVPSYNELDSDVVLTTASPTAWNRPQPIGNEIVIKSNVLTLIYAALYKEGTKNNTSRQNDVDKYIILGNTTDFVTDADNSIDSTRVWQFTADTYNATTGKFSFTTSVSDEATKLSCERVDTMLKGIAPNLLQSNDTMDITVNGIDDDRRNLYTTTLTYTGSELEKTKQYPSNLFAGLLEKNFAAYESKQAICIAVSKYNLGTGVNTTENPPFKFSYKKSGLFKVLDEVVLDFSKYYYIVYHFAPEGSFVRALRLFSKPTKNADALKDYVVIAGKNDAYVDLELPDSKMILEGSSNTYTTFTVTSTYTDSNGVLLTTTLTHSGGPSSSRYQFFTLESELYGGGRTENAIVGKRRLRVHLGTDKLHATTSKIEINAVYNNDTANAKSFKGSISKRNILNLDDALSATATTRLFIELRKSGTGLPLPSLSDAEKKVFNDDISQWDIKAMAPTFTDFSSLLSGFESFNQPLGNWNTSLITSMANMFKDAKSFNQPINTWNTGNVTSMVSMFEGATSFNQSLAGWDIGSATDVSSMFLNASAFNGSVSFSESTSAIADHMFEGATSFNQPFSSFTVSTCQAMFKNASAFNQFWAVNSGSGLILSNDCEELSEMFKNAISLGQGTVFTSITSHTLPSAVTTTASMFEGASSWNCALNGGGNALGNVSSMYKGATSFNKSVTITAAAASLDCSNMFEGALSMNSHVVLPATGTSVTLNDMFKNAVVFNKDVTFGVRKITSAQRMFQGAAAYGNDDGNDASGSKPKPMLGSLSGTTRRYFIDYNDPSATAKPFEYMFDGTRFDDEVVGTGPADCSYMFAGASYFNTPLGSGFMNAATNLTGMFQDATSLQVSPFLTADTGFLTNVTTLEKTFKGATKFNADITGWGAGKLDNTLTNMNSMFHSATSFNQDLPTHWTSVSGASKIDAFTNASAYTFAKTWTAS
jgi:surface protein